MGFLAPTLLWGLSLTALPVAIHLFSRRRYRRVPWAAMSFLSAAWTARSRSVRLEHLLLLALRTAALALFALALARPVIHGARAPSADAIVLVDRSASMHYRDGSGTLFEAAVARASDVILSLGPDSRVALATFDSRVRFLTPPAGAAPQAAVALLAPLAPGWGPTDYSAALAEATRATREFGLRAPAVIVVSDFREGAAAAFPVASAEFPGGLFLVPVARAGAVNRGISSLSASGAAFAASGDLVDVRVTNYSPETQKLLATLTSPSTAAVSLPIELPAEGELTLAAPLAGLSRPGAHLVTASLTPDAYSGDDVRYAVLESGALSVTLLAAAPARRFLSAALAAGPEGAFTISTQPDAHDIDGYILAGDFPSGDVARAVWRRVREGGFAVVFAGGASTADAARFLAASGVAALGEAVVTGRTLSSISGLGVGPHPLGVFVERTGGASLAALRLKAVAEITAPVADAAIALYVKTPDGPRAFLYFADVGEGMVAVFAAAADRSGGDFVISPLFLPLLYQTLAHAAGRAAGAEAECGRLVLIPTDTSAAAHVVGPGRGGVGVWGGVGVGEVETRLTTAAGGFAHAFVPEAPGFYRLGEAVVAVNVPRGESDSRVADLAALAERSGATVLSGGRNLSDALAPQATVREISGGLLLAALLALVAEMIVVRLVRGDA